MKRSFADILAGLDDDRTRKVARKLPEWAAADAQRRAAGLDGLEFPTVLSLEQCSSTSTARYKATLAASAPGSGQLPPETSGCAGPLPSGDGPLPLTMPRVARFPEAVAAPAQQAVLFWPQNWRKGGLQERRNEVIREQGFYNQTWCGCEFSRNSNP